MDASWTGGWPWEGSELVHDGPVVGGFRTDSVDTECCSASWVVVVVDLASSSVVVDLASWVVVVVASSCGLDSSHT